jgi:hypothetical protein
VDQERSGWVCTLSRPAVLVCAALVVSRLLVFFAAPQREDLGPYPGWAQEFKLAERSGVSFYKVHEQEALRRSSRAWAEGRQGAVEDHHSIEYPPLSMAAIQLPAAVLPAQVSEGPIEPDLLRRYVCAFRLEMLAFDLFAFFVLAVLAARLFPRESHWERGERLLLYVVGTALLGHLLYNRLDIVMAALILLAAALLLSRVHYFWSFLALAAAINFKIVPLVLLPVWVIGSLPARWPTGGFLRSLPPLLGRSGLLLLLVAALFAPYWLVYGSQTLDFFAYHRDRGLEVESTYSSALMCLRPFGLALGIEFRYGGLNLTSSLSPTVARLAGAAASAAVASASLLLLWLVARRRRAEECTGEATLAQTYPLLFVFFTLLLLLLTVAFNKVFSPQYLFWVAPLAALAPFRAGPRRVVMWGFVGICALTTLIFPVLFWKYVVGVVTPETNPTRYFGPTAVGIAAVVVRNVLFLGLTTFVAVLVRSHVGRFFTPEPRGRRAEATLKVRPPGIRRRAAAALASIFFSL